MKNKLRIKLFIIGIIFFLIGVICFSYYYENLTLANVSFFDVIENIIIVLMGEYPNTPQSIQMRIMQLVLLVLSTVLFGAVVGKFSAYFTIKAQKIKPKPNLKNHYIICNWNEKGKKVVSELQKGMRLSNCKTNKIVIITTTKLNVKEFRSMENIILIIDDPIKHTVLKNYGIKNAKSIIVLSDDEIQKPDERNILITLLVKDITNDNNKVNIIVELLDMKFKYHLKVAAGKEKITIIFQEDYSAGIIAQSSLFKNTSKVYSKLLNYSKDTNEMYYEKDIDTNFIGKSFSVVSNLLYESNNETNNNPSILIGVKQKGEDKIRINPRKNLVLKEGDELIYLSYELQKMKKES